MTPLTAIAQLRHLYDQMLAPEPVMTSAEAARVLLNPAIEALEKVHTPGAPVEVKPLVWVQRSPDLYDSPSIDRAVFQLARRRTAVTELWDLSFLGYAPLKRTEHPTLAAAQAAADQEWQAFIRAAVEETPTTSTSGWTEVSEADQRATTAAILRVIIERDRELLGPEEIATARANIRAGLSAKP